MAGSQDMFDAVVMADDRFHGEGYQEGYEEGSSLGMIEGRRHGTLHGAKIGSEIGCYQGFALAWRCLLHGCTTEKDRTWATAIWKCQSRDAQDSVGDCGVACPLTCPVTERVGVDRIRPSAEGRLGEIFL
ncbi:protein LTO1 homolog isoform X2 [Globicephala melas]|uniref:protein LTO1 homolog isoform X2 n=1 Tax=Globicephala melas TaxID=9731 RepID=UPI00293D519D|nr:protein LTO1 homolog isoform X2 [Globicephala melas]